MANYYLCLFIFRIILPIILGACTVFRPCGLSAIYFLFLVLLPFFPVPTASSMRKSTGIYLKMLIATSVLTFLAQLSFQIVLLAMPPYGHFLTKCELLEKLMRHVGLVRLDELHVVSVITWISPEVVMLVSSILVYVVCNQLLQRRSVEVVEHMEHLPRKAKSGRKKFALMVAVGKYATLVAMCVAAVLRPSVQGGLYFLVFLSAATWWACCKELGKAFAVVMRCLMVVVLLHMIAIYGYQFQWPQELLESDSKYARYFGLTPILTVNCTKDARDFNWVHQEWATYASPVALFLLYYVLALESKFLLKPQLIRGVSPSRKYGSGSRRPVIQDSTGSVTVTGDNPDDIPMNQLEEDYKPTFFDNFMFAMEALLQVIIKSSYVVTNIIMMAWSITYLSWITFVLLLWANLLWLVPNQRKSMLRSSPFLVLYAWFLLISAYIYSMNLTDEELPDEIEGYNLAQIGFKRVKELPCNPLLVKCLFTAMFWITLRQYVRESIDERQNNALADMVAPLQVTVGAAAGGTHISEREQEQGSKFMERMGKALRKFLTKFWIWVVAITLFAVAITGQKMTGFRIVYMALFLFFVLSFQISFRAWRKMMFGFWLIVIVYSMIILVMVYTYQFDHFDTYWEEYLHVPVRQQQDIGLERFKTTQLFVRLVTPTFFVIITVVQLHYFHKDFMEMSDPKNASVLGTDLDQSSLQGGAAADSDKDTTILSSPKYDLTETDSSHTRWHLWRKQVDYFVDVFYVFLELHMPKFVLFFLMLVCIFDKCALYFVLIVLITLACTFGRPMQIGAIYVSSVCVSLMLLARMIFQIDYIQPEKWNVTCEYTNRSEVVNNTKWLGFYKTNDEYSLPYLVRWNIIYILVVTIWAVVLVRQFNYRVSQGKPTIRAFFMFPRVTRADADKDVWSCIKFLFNYGFYKFGVEICLMATVATIGFRMDMYSVIYSIWLCVLFNLKRSVLAKVWNFYMAFIALLLPIQYVMTVGLPPSLCVLFPWDKEYWSEDGENKADLYRRLQDWAYLLDTQYPPSPKKLICDFILLLLVSRQSVVFRIERRYTGHEYHGGSNESIIHHAEEKDFVNPVHDYISSVRSYLDVFKKGVFSSFLWITLAIVFLAGTNRVNIFSIGYLVGAFIFLWQGTDLFLRPIPKILILWDWFLGYNVIVILLKTALQIVGCIFIKQIEYCWVVQLLGIGCVRKFGDLASQAGHSSDIQCKVPREFVGLLWDGMCFGFMLMQKRLFQSYYFFHMIDEIKASTILASRGAELIEELRLQRMTEQEEQERRVLEKIKAKMDKIKANQQKIQGTSYKDSENHYVAVRSGDYYMFDDLDDEDELDFMEEAKEGFDDDQPFYRGQTISEFLSSALKNSVSETVRRHSEIEIKRRASTPLTSRKSTRSQVSVPYSAPPIVEEHGPRSVTIVDKAKKPDEPQPGTSKDEDTSETSHKEQNWRQKLVDYVMFVWVFIQSSIISLTNFLNRYSKDYRYVMRVLAKEKKLLKENTDYSLGLRLGSGQVWQPAASYNTLLRQSRPQQSQIEFDDYDGNTEMSSYDQPPIVRLLLAIWYIIMSRSENVCYFIIFLNQIKSATFLSLPLPLMVFLWGTLTIPRPNKTFWVTIIAYTEVIVLIKCMFQFDIISWNMSTAVNTSPFYAPRIIGIERNKNYAVWDLLLLLVVFFHRFMLKSMGLWKTSPVPAALLAEGDYRVTPDGKMEPIDVKARKSSKHSSKGSATSIRSSDPTSKASDLQRLVEESEDHEDDDRKDSIQQSISSENMENKVVSVQSEVVEPLAHMPQSIKMALIKYGENIKIFFNQLRDPTSRVAADVYSYMFLCDFYNFFVILIGYSSFGAQQGDGGVSSYLEDNRVPVLFLLMLILQFMLIIVDRGIFLRKNIMAKIIFQFIQVFILHIWLFILFPIITERGFNSVLAPQMYYMVKCFYLLLSAYQIRCGYPTRILGNFLCKGYNYVNMFLFKGFMAVPFLFELRTVMDWMWTDTSMTVFDWIKMEDIFAHIFQLKCTRHVENEYPQPRGERKTPIVKYAMGGAILTLIIAIIWFPLVFFSLGNAVGEANPPFDVTLEIRIGPYEPVYQMSAQSNFIYSFSQNDMDTFQRKYGDHKSALTFISNYEAEDIAAVKLSLDSANIWSISPPDRKRMVAEVQSDKPLTVRLDYKVSHRSSKPEDSGVIPEYVQIRVPATISGKRNPMRENLLNMLQGDTNKTMLLTSILPKFLKVTNRGTAKAVSQLMFDNLDDPDDAKGISMRNLTLSLGSSKTNESGNNFQEWWKIKEDCSDFNFNKILKDIPYQDCNNSIILYTFNDKVFPSTLSIITAGGIFGLYALYFVAVFRVCRTLTRLWEQVIWLDDMPNIQRIYILLNDIYIVRAFREYRLEEDLFAKLVFLMRSREMAIKFTRLHGNPYNPDFIYVKSETKDAATG